MGKGEFDVQMRIAYAVADLLVAPAGKHGKRGAEGNHAHAGKAGGHGDHVCLGDAAVKKAVGIGLGKIRCHRGAGKISIQHDDFLIFSAEPDKLFAVTHARGFFFTHAQPSSSSSAAAASAALGAFPCHPAFPSIKETPFPLTVWQRMHLGTPGRCGASSAAMT